MTDHEPRQPTEPAPPTRVEAADLADKYDRMLRLADLFDSSGQEMRTRSKLGAEVLRDEGVAESAELAKATFDAAADDIRSATTGKHGLLTRSIELDADALVVRATVLTYRWIDELQEAAYETLGSIAGRAIGYLAPGVALGPASRYAAMAGRHAKWSPGRPIRMTLRDCRGRCLTPGRARTRRAGRGCGTRPSAPPRRTSTPRSRRCPSGDGARG
jgi:hypothetical protein